MTTIPHSNLDPPRIEGYEILRRIGSGSYGEVWLARPAAQQYCALKVIHRSAFDNERPFEREFNGIRKFVPVSRRHASQVAILDVGRNEKEGYFYYAMELADHAGEGSDKADGGDMEPVASFDPSTYRPKTLKSVLDGGRRLSVAQSIEIGLALATALDHLHRHGLIHRDIKPSNVIFVNGVPKLADIGLVTDMDATISYVGTEGFLPPEGPGTPQADLYSLGKVLYEISTGLDRLEFPELPSVIHEEEGGPDLLEFNLVFLRACQNDVSRRYQSARELSADLALLQAGKSLRRSRHLERRLAQGKKVSVVAVVALLVLIGVYYLAERSRLEQLRQETRRQERDKEVAQQVAVDTRNRLANAYAASADRAGAEGDFYGALAWLTASWMEQPNAETRHVLNRRLHRLASHLPPVPLVVHRVGGWKDALLSADRHLLIAAPSQAPVRRWPALPPYGSSTLLPESCQGREVAANSDGTVVAIWGYDGQIRVWRESSVTVTELQTQAPVVAVDFRFNERRIATATRAGHVALWDVTNGRERFHSDVGGEVSQLLLSPDERCLAVASGQGAVRVWNLEDGTMLEPQRSKLMGADSMAWAPDSRRLVFAWRNTARIWNVTLNEPSPIQFSHDGEILDVDFSPDGTQLVTGGEDGIARLWHSVTGALKLTTPRHDLAVSHVRFSPDGRQFFTVAGNRWQLWSTANAGPWAPPIILGAAIQSARFSEAGDCVVIAGGDGTARIVQVRAEAFSVAGAWINDPSDVETTSSNLDSSSENWSLVSEYWTGRAVDEQGRLSHLDEASWEQVISARENMDVWWNASNSLATWHEFAAAQSAENDQWFSAWYHYHELADAPGDHRQAQDRAIAAWERYIEVQSIECLVPEQERARIPQRSDAAGWKQIDLTLRYNASFDRTWFPTNIISSGNDLSSMPRGLVEFGRVTFDARGLVQLSGAVLENVGGQFPRRVRAIPVERSAQRVHFLHGLAGADLVGTHVGSYRVQYDNGDEEEIRLVYGENIRDWWFRPHQPELTTRAAIAWQGENAASRQLGMGLRLYQMTWINPRPDREIANISFESTMEKPAPFLIAVTLE